MIARLSPTDSTALILGESGTGKNLVAKAIHYNGPRRDAPFVSENCGAVSESLLESEWHVEVKIPLIGGQIEAGFAITGLYEDAMEGHPSSTHLPNMIATRARKV